MSQQKRKQPQSKKALTEATYWVDLEERAYAKGFVRPVGIDEAGRGCLAGPVVAAACYIPRGIKIPGIADSKTLSYLERKDLYAKIRECPGVDYGFYAISNEEIDRINILQASLKAMLMAADQLKEKPDYLLIDGNRAPETHLIAETVVKGDSKIFSIAAASIIAKCVRDEMMIAYDELYPGYGFRDNKGYGTEEHMKALLELGFTPIHRMSYSPVASCNQLDLFGGELFD